MSSQQIEQQLYKNFLINNHKANPQSYKENFDLGIFMSRFRESIVDSIAFLLTALKLSPTEEDRTLILSQLYIAFGCAGDRENELRAIRALTESFPQYLKYLDQYTNICLNSGLTKEAEISTNTAYERSIYTANKLSRQYNEDIPVQTIVDGDELFNSFGELACRFDIYIKARILGLVHKSHILCRQAPHSSSFAISNKFLLELWKMQACDNIEFVKSEEEFQKIKTKYSDCEVLLTKFPLPSGTLTSTVSSRNYIYNRWFDERLPPLLQLPAQTAHQGRLWLADFGMPKDAWFVCIHIRDGGYKNGSEGLHNQFRNCNANNYRDAITAITKHGGWVVRIGNESPLTMDDLPQVIDYANHSDQADWKDIFLLSQCRFFMGNNSGPICVAQVFGVPTVTTDMFPVGLIWGTPQDVVIHKLVRRINDGAYLPIHEAAALGVGSEHSPIIYEKRGLAVEDNSSEDLVAVAIEMIERLDGKWQSSPADREQQKKYADLFPMAPNQFRVNIGKSFLENHPFLLES